MNSGELKSAAQALKLLFNSFQPAGPIDVEGQAEAYLWAVKDHELVDVEQAVFKFTQGEVADFNGAFCPSTAQLCTEIRQRQKVRGLLAARDARNANGGTRLAVVGS